MKPNGSAEHHHILSSHGWGLGTTLVLSQLSMFIADCLRHPIPTEVGIETIWEWPTPTVINH